MALSVVLAAVAVATPRAALLDAIAPLNRGFSAKPADRKAVAAAIDVLAKAAPAQQAVPDIGGDWELVYTDAPDILGLDAQAGPFVRCSRIGQRISEREGTIENVIEYEPREWATSLFSNLKGDRLQQRVVTSFARREGAPATVDLKIRGVRLLPRQALGVSLESAPPLQLLGPLEPPFGSFEVLYCEGPEGPPLAEGDSAADESLDRLCRQASLTSLALTPRPASLPRPHSASHRPRSRTAWTSLPASATAPPSEWCARSRDTSRSTGGSGRERAGAQTSVLSVWRCGEGEGGPRGGRGPVREEVTGCDSEGIREATSSSPAAAAERGGLREFIRVGRTRC
jgi:hypothetical protein